MSTSHAPRPPTGPGGIYYGWLLVTALALAEMTSWGVLYYAFTVFLEPMHRELGWSNASIAGAFSLALLLSGLVGLPLGRWLDQFGPRVLMTAGSCVAVVLLLAWSSVRTLSGFYLIWAGLGVAMSAVLYEPAFWVVSVWFTRRRGLALTLLTVIAGLASVVYVPLSGWLVATQGWRHALVILAALVLVGTLPIHALMLRRRPEDLGLVPDGKAAPEPARATPAAAATPAFSTLGDAMRGSAFWLVTVAFFSSALCSGAVFVYLVPYLTQRGFSPQAAATFVGFIGLMALPGRLVLTPLGDHVSRALTTAAIFLTQAVACALLLQIPGTLGVIAFIVLFGAGFGAVSPARAGLLVDYFGAAHFGRINSVVALAVSLARGLAPALAGILYEFTGTYRAVFWAQVVLLLVAALASVLARRQSRRAGYMSSVGRYGG
ncbi:MAG TPA: MFS transporter [Ktedonobacterales bacterium]|nr:MFS transporter [Ktedonobacterales bacterium]